MIIQEVDSHKSPSRVFRFNGASDPRGEQTSSNNVEPTNSTNKHITDQQKQAQ